MVVSMRAFVDGEHISSNKMDASLENSEANARLAI